MEHQRCCNKPQNEPLDNYEAGARRNEEPDCEVPMRKKGTGSGKKCRKGELDAIENALETNPFLTSRDLKLKTLMNIDGRTVRRIIGDDLDRPAKVAHVKA